MSVAPQLDPTEPSPLASARLQRKLTVEEAARRVGLPPEQIEWLEDGRVYRFPSADDALVGAILYATGLGIDAGEARTLARLPIDAPVRRRNSRLIAAAVAAMLLIALAITLAGAFGGDAKKRTTKPAVPPY